MRYLPAVEEITRLSHKWLRHTPNDNNKRYWESLTPDTQQRLIVLYHWCIDNPVPESEKRP